MGASVLENRERLEPSVRELWCRCCGYGVVIRRDPPQCPVCRQTSWCERPPLTRSN